ncbi:MAG: serine/threonine protein kinase, partial [Planctomycetes bacterium]|nr:serine/threonine protein kinase [Planctomycetota bacterium]
MANDKEKDHLRRLLEAVEDARDSEPRNGSGDDSPGEELPVKKAAGASLFREPGPGDCIGDFRLIRELGRGGMGVVYEAEQISLSRRVALKVLHPGLTRSTRAVHRFQREAEAVARLSHPSIIPIYAVGEENGLHFFAMRYLSGPTLADLIDDLRQAKRSHKPVVVVDLFQADPSALPADAPTPEEPSVMQFRVGNYVYQAVAMMADIADALEVAHRGGVIHRDIKPSNLVFDNTGRLVLTDFGIAKTETDVSITRTGEFLGSPGYISPEQAMTRRVAVDHRTDVYSLGVTFYELLTLVQPFLKGTMEATLRAILYKPPVSPRKLNPRLPKDVEIILLKSMEKDADRRFTTSGEFAAEMHHILNFEAIGSSPVSGLTRLWRLAEKNRGAVVAGVSVLILATVSTVLQYQKSVNEEDLAIRLKRAEVSGSVADRELFRFVAGDGTFDIDAVVDLIRDASSRLKAGRVDLCYDLLEAADARYRIARETGHSSRGKFFPALSSVKVETIAQLEALPTTRSRGRLAPNRIVSMLAHFLEDVDPLVVKNAAVAL